MHLQLIKNAQVQPARRLAQLMLSHSSRGVRMCAHLFLMAAAGVDAAPDLGFNFKRKFRADVFYNLFMARQKKKQQQMENMSCSRRRITKRFGFGFLAATSGNLWFTIICVTLWQHTQEEIASGSSTARARGSALLFCKHSVWIPAPGRQDVAD